MKTFGFAAMMLFFGCSKPTRPYAPVALGPDITERGTLIYEGSSFPLSGAATNATYVYQRRVEALNGALTSTHVTRDPTNGAIQIAESATHSADYSLNEYTLYGDQLGQRGSVKVEGNKVTLRLIDDDGEHVKRETRTEPVLTGPTLVGFIFKNLKALEGKQTRAVRLAVLDRLETIGFELSVVDAQKPGQTRIKMSATNFIYSLALEPIFFTFDTATGQLVRLEGRIPPKVRDGNTWADFDARVEYRFIASAYQ